ncbi:hypothetical protein GCM10011349_17320 [Novosphingobium indicum]|uniref:Uncharacterized protein n=1 Tax=Novosphingobium indicum TaxID=462949 RepID=A0ABQ2JJS1_9SPHN|nr:hypothetical protein GCM10011349_17320 [Novosphingobium indicum]
MPVASSHPRIIGTLMACRQKISSGSDTPRSLATFISMNIVDSMTIAASRSAIANSGRSWEEERAAEVTAGL